MKLVKTCLGVLLGLGVACLAFADEECPTAATLSNHLATDSIPAMMPYPVNMEDPILQTEQGGDRDGEKFWFVVTNVGITLRGDPTKYVAFAVFADPSNDGISSQYSKPQAIAYARSLTASVSRDDDTAVDYPSFYIGDGPDGTQYRFDVCIYAGDLGGDGENYEDLMNGSTLPIVMADLSPGISATSVQALEHKIMHHAN